jgi:hypothetical protein
VSAVRSVGASAKAAVAVSAKANDPPVSQDARPESHERPVDVSVALATMDVPQGARSVGAEEEEAETMDARGLGIRWTRARGMETRNVDAR